MIRNLFFSVLCLLVSVFCASAQARQIKTYLHSGTGFVVSGEGHVVTNLHVVSYCKRLTVRGAIGEREARMIARNDADDLALLKIDAMPTETGAFRAADAPLKAGERVLTVGYPGEAGLTGNLVTRESRIERTKGPLGEEKWVELGDVVEQGNSGGPLLDTSGNIIGVVAAQAVVYTYYQDEPDNGTTRHSGIAVAGPTVMAFLDRQHVRYRTADPGDYLSAERITDNAQRFIVHVRCAYKTEVR